MYFSIVKLILFGTYSTRFYIVLGIVPFMYNIRVEWVRQCVCYHTVNMYIWYKRWSKNHCSVLVGHPCVVEHIDDLPVVPRTRSNVWSFKPRHFFLKLSTLTASNAKSQDQSLTNTDICSVLNVSKVPLTEVETLLLFKGVNFRPTLHDVVDKSKKRIPEHFPNA